MIERHNRLALVRVLAERSDDNHVMGLWLCDCGQERRMALSRVRNGYSKSCGCLARDKAKARQAHGQRYSRAYSSWIAMKGRCLDPGNKDYPRWGGKGVTVCPEWQASFEAFFAYVGPRPLATTLDRIDNRKGYEPGNVRWATHEEQAANRSDNWTVEIDGQVFGSVQAAARFLGVSDTTITRWCDGYRDSRRPHLGLINKRPNCRRWRTYAA